MATPRIDTIIKKIQENGSDNLGRFGGTQVGGYYLQQNPKEFAELVQLLIKTKPEIGTLLEIGAAAGGSVKTICDFVKVNKIYIIDDNKHPKHVHRSELLKGLDVTEYIGDSHSRKCKQWVKDLDVKFDLVFFDGEHSYGGISQDFKMIKEKLNPNAILVFHDSAQPICGIDRFLEDLDLESNFKMIQEFVADDIPIGIAVYEYLGQ